MYKLEGHGYVDERISRKIYNRIGRNYGALLGKYDSKNSRFIRSRRWNTGIGEVNGEGTSGEGVSEGIKYSRRDQFARDLKREYKYTDTVENVAKKLDSIVNASKNIQAERNNTTTKEGSGEVKHSIRAKFYEEYDAWDKKNPRKRFVVGNTSEILQSLGINNSPITWDAAKIIKIKAKHPEMTDKVIKQVPNILEKPIIVMRSQNVSTRFTMFGEVYVNEKPVLAVLELKPTDRNGLFLDEIKIASAYGKDRAQNFINNSEVLYVEKDKKRVSEWEKRTRLQLPVGIFRANSISSISSSSENVNTKYSERGNGYYGCIIYVICDNEVEDKRILAVYGIRTNYDRATTRDIAEALYDLEEIGYAEGNANKILNRIAENYEALLGRYSGKNSRFIRSRRWNTGIGEVNGEGTSGEGVSEGVKYSRRDQFARDLKREYKYVIYDNEVEDKQILAVYGIRTNYDRATTRELAEALYDMEEIGYAERIRDKVITHIAKNNEVLLGRYSSKNSRFVRTRRWNTGIGEVNGEGTSGEGVSEGVKYSRRDQFARDLKREYKYVIYDNEVEDKRILAVYGIRTNYDRATTREIAEALYALEETHYAGRYEKEILKSINKRYGALLGKYSSENSTFYRTRRNTSRNGEVDKQGTSGEGVFEGVKNY